MTLVSPAEIDLRLENILSKEVPVELRQTGSLPIGYEAGTPVLSQETALVIGPESQVQKVEHVVASIDLSSVITSISRQVDLKAIDARGVIVNGINLSPTQVNVEIPITQLGGYRNVFVKIVTTGQIAQGFYLTGILADPPTITIYSTDPELAANMPAFIETKPLNLNGAVEGFQKDVSLNLPEGIGVVPFYIPGSPELMSSTVAKLRVHRIVIWAKHGVMARSDISVKRAADLVEYAETAAKYEYLNLGIGEIGEGLDAQEIRTIADTFHIQQRVF